MPTSPRKPATECYAVAHQTQTVTRNPRNQQPTKAEVLAQAVAHTKLLRTQFL
jgi:hypothetical protein